MELNVLSQPLIKFERNYSVIEKDALAIIYGIRKFQQFLCGRRFTFLTDHQLLTSLFGSKTTMPAVAASRIQRWAIKLLAYQGMISGTVNPNRMQMQTRYPDFRVKQQMFVNTLIPAKHQETVLAELHLNHP